MLGSFDSYIDQQIAVARAEGAPADAIYRDRDGAWKTTDDVVAADTRRELGLDPLPPIPVTVTALVTETADALRCSTALRDRHGLAQIHPDGAVITLTFTTGHTGLIRFEAADPDPTA